LGQIIDWIDQTRVEDNPDDGYGLGLTYTVSNHSQGDLGDRLEFFTTVESELYPQLREHYRKLASEWVFQKFVEHQESETRTGLIKSLIEEGKATDEADAIAMLKEHGF
jgi:hypothetical protein